MVAATLLDVEDPLEGGPQYRPPITIILVIDTPKWECYLWETPCTSMAKLVEYAHDFRESTSELLVTDLKLPLPA